MHGLTLVEMIVVIVITGIISAAVAVFIRRPVEGYIDSVRRAQLTDRADNALRRIGRDLRLALPNSVRVDPSGRYIEFLLTSGGGRYREEPDGGGAGDTLSFTAADTSFDVLGPVPAFSGGESIVVYNLFADAGVATSNAYHGDNRRAYASHAGSTVSIAPNGASPPFPLSSPGRRFHVVTQAVTYECDTVAGTVRRYASYAIAAAQATPPGGGSALLVDGVTGCSFAYDAAVVAQRAGLVTLALQLSQEGETVSLLQQTHVSNIP